MSAPNLDVPLVKLCSVEFPGPFLSEDATNKALAALGGIEAVTRSLNAEPNSADSSLELDLSPGQLFARPIQGDPVATNDIVLRVVKRRRKNPRRDQHGRLAPGGEGVYSVEAVGAIAKTYRFRSTSAVRLSVDVRRPRRLPVRA